MSELTKEAMEYVVGLSVPHTIIGKDGNTYVDKNMARLDSLPLASAIKMSTLSSLVNYIKGNIDTMSSKMIVHVVSPTQVDLYSSLNEDRKRENIVTVNAEIPAFSFNNYIDRESFGIALQSKFIGGEPICTDKELLLAFVGNVEDGTVAAYGDDGVTQKATVKTGIASKADAKVPNPVKLMPFRTFLEVGQPVSDFIFRMKSDKYDGIVCAIFEADGGAWKLDAMQNIKTYLTTELEGLAQFTVIS